MCSLKRRGRSEKGAEVVEFALMLLPMLAFLFLVINVAWVIFTRACLQEAVREGVRYAITGHPDASVQTYTQQHSFGAISQACSVQVQYFSPTSLSTPVTSFAAGDVVEISISNMGVSTLAPLLISPAAVPLSASASDIMQTPPTGTTRGVALTCS